MEPPGVIQAKPGCGIHHFIILSVHDQLIAIQSAGTAANLVERTIEAVVELDQFIACGNQGAAPSRFPQIPDGQR